MRVLYLDTFSGIAGDMTLAALVDCGADPDAIAGRIGALGLSEVRLEFTPTMRHGFRALRLDVHHPPEHAHRHLRDIEAMIDRGDLSPRARRMALSVFQKVAEAEARVHGTTVEQVHFHEVGAVDSIVDIVGVAVAIDLLGIDRIVAAPPVTGTGIIRIAHGRVSVPAPATIEILRGIPVRGSHIEAELTTPTGAAILAALADDYGPMPSMRIERTGCGAGHRELQEQANVLRAVVGELASAGQDVVWLLETNLDDATGEQIGYAMAQIMQSGALDVFATPIFMKKNRPATLVSALCRPADRQAVESCMLLYTGSLGVRCIPVERRVLRRMSLELATRLGEIPVKLAWSASPASIDQVHIAPEFDACQAIADRQRISLQAVYREALASAQGAAETILQAIANASDATTDAAPPPRTPNARSEAGGDAIGHDHHGGHDHHH